MLTCARTEEDYFGKLLQNPDGSAVCPRPKSSPQLVVFQPMRRQRGSPRPFQSFLQ